MTDVVLVFEVHQPFRIRKDFFWDRRMFKRVGRKELFEYYFDKDKNREIFERACRKCYLPSNEIILRSIDKHKSEKRKVKAAFSLSGVFLEQCEMFNKDVLESFKALADTGCVEFLDQTYYHSLSGLYPVRDEFMEQVKAHKQAMQGLLHFTPSIFENTELLYNNAIARIAEKLGYIGIYTEGVERVLGDRSPNHIYGAKDCHKLKVLLRNYKLTDDVGFRFSARWWNEWPLTAEKYASWLASTPGQCITIFPDYETFGEHQWPETGIHEFLAYLPEEILRHENLDMAMPSEVANRYEPVGVVDVPELGGTVSWADLERDASCWIGNTMQWAYYSSVRDMERLVKESADRDFIRLWRYFQTSDHLYYMFTAGGAPGEVHTYFNPYGSPIDAFVTCQSAIMDLEQRVRMVSVAANEPFEFYLGVGEDKATGVSSLTLRGFVEAIKKVDIASVEFHNSRGDFERWAKSSLHDQKLATRLKKIRGINLSGEKLRNEMLRITRSHIDESLERMRSLALA
jgi:alpha-amylase